MGDYKVSEHAQRDLIDISKYLARNNPDAMVRIMKAIRDKFRFLAQFPNTGRERNDMLLYLRTFPAGKYIIFYQPTDDGVEILRVRHSLEDTRDLFDNP